MDAGGSGGEPQLTAALCVQDEDRPAGNADIRNSGPAGGLRKQVTNMLKRIVGAAVGFALGCLALVVVFGLIYVLMDLFDVSRARVRVPVFLVVLPIVGAIYGLKAAPTAFEAALPLWEVSMAFRAATLLPITWIVLVLLYIYLFEPRPFRYGWDLTDSDQFLALLKLALLPPALVAALFWVFVLIRGKK